MRILRAADRRAVPWKNGGGITRDVAAFPAGPSPDSFDWRISIAEIAASGPFSSFPGIDRQFAVLDGTVAMTLDGKMLRIDPKSDVLSFPGETAIHAEPIGGISTDLNVMTRRDRLTARMRRMSAAYARHSASFTILLALGDLTVATPQEEARLAALDAVLLDGGATPLALTPSSEFYLIEISALPPR